MDKNELIVIKQLAGVEDLLTGVGKVTQPRGSTSKEITRINVSELGGVLVVDTADLLKNLNSEILGPTGLVLVKDEMAYYKLNGEFFELVPYVASDKDSIINSSWTFYKNITMLDTPTNLNHLVTLGYVNNTFVSLAKDDQIDGIKTFINSPQVPSPVNINDAVSKGYIDSLGLGGTVDGTNTGGNIVGSIIIWASPFIPPGYLECNGQELSRSSYSKLFQAIGTTWGSGDGSTTFNAPNFTDMFVRHRGKERAIGTYQGMNVQSSGVSMYNSGDTDWQWDQKSCKPFKVSRAESDSKGDSNSYISSTRSAGLYLVEGLEDNRGEDPDVFGYETRPNNYAIMYIIKY